MPQDHDRLSRTIGFGLMAHGLHVAKDLRAAIAPAEAAKRRVESRGRSVSAMVMGIDRDTGCGHFAPEPDVAPRMLGQPMQNEKDGSRWTLRKKTMETQGRAGRAIEKGRAGEHGTKADMQTEN